MKFIFNVLLTIAIIAFGFWVTGYEKEVKAAGDISKDKIVELLVGVLDAVKSLQVDSQQSMETPDFFLGGFSDRGCNFTNTASSTVVASSPTQLLATSTRRAWARIQKDLSAVASSTIFLSFNGAVSGAFSNIALNASSTETAIEIGLNTEIPYTGSVHAITNTGSTYVLVTECVYP